MTDNQLTAFMCFSFLFLAVPALIVSSTTPIPDQTVCELVPLQIEGKEDSYIGLGKIRGGSMYSRDYGYYGYCKDLNGSKLENWRDNSIVIKTNDQTPKVIDYSGSRLTEIYIPENSLVIKEDI